ncbi:MAG: DUF6361 family protein [bacterium]
MESVFSWVDFAEEDKNKMHELINSLNKPDTRDEIGISPIRDAISNLLFPGTTTIQTRIKYFLFVPWLYKKLEEEKLYGQDAAERIRELEITLIKSLKENNSEATGIIGKEAGAAISRTPADISWSGLKKWGILKVDFSRRDFNDLLKYYYKSSAEDFDLAAEYYLENIDLYRDQIQLWDQNLIKSPPDFPQKADLNLRPREADYLREKIKKSCPQTLLSVIVDLPYSDVNYVWEHEYLYQIEDHNLEKEIEHAQNFSQLINGAQLLYNLMLAQKIEGREEREEEFLNQIQKWKKLIANQKYSLQNWDLNDFWGITQVSDLRLRSFVENWYKICLREDYLENIESSSTARKIIKDREKWTKGKRARLFNQEYLEKWGGASAVSMLDYRWGIVNNFIKDLKAAEDRSESNAQTR